MNKPVVKILLAVVTIFLWIFVAYRIYYYYKENDTEESLKDFENISDFNMVLNDTFKLSLDYRDPFLDDKPVNIADLNKKTNIVKVINQKEPCDFPEFKYNGTIINNKTGKKNVVIQFNNKSYVLALGESINKFVLCEVYKDSILIKKDHCKKYIKRVI